MYLDKSFKSRFLKLSLFLLGYVVLEHILKFTGIFDYWEGNFGINKTKLTLYFLFSLTPLTLVWIFIGANIENRKAAMVGMSVFLLFAFCDIFYSIYGDDSSLVNYSYWWRITGNTLAFGVYGLIRYKNPKALFFMLFALVIFGFSYTSSPRIFFDKIFDLMRWMGLVGFRSDYTSAFSILSILTTVFSASMFLVQFYLFHYFEKLIEMPKLFNLRLSRIEWKEQQLNPLTFSLIFWGFRIFIISSFFTTSVMMISKLGQEEFDPRILIYLISTAFVLYVAISAYRNFLTCFYVNQSKFPSWQFFFLNISLINFFVWLAVILNMNKEKEDILALDENSESETQKPNTILWAKDQFKKSKKNQGIKALSVTLYILLFCMSFFLIVASGRSTEKEMFSFLLTSVISITLVVWYLEDYRAPHILVILVALVGIGSYLAGFTDLVQQNVMGSIINLTLCFSLFHFDKVEFYIQKESDPIEDLDKEEKDIVLL